ncbi:hypothetical protein [Anaerosolibacter sp.]|uniref:hypothetical protein n=1 Tax=Anaerosolibacter sp. TaxID=1872527 RepID=UPI0039F003BF
MSLYLLEIERDLAALCTEMIGIFVEMKNRGIISEDVYEKHVKLKAEFLNDYRKKYVAGLGQN